MNELTIEQLAARTGEVLEAAPGQRMLHRRAVSATGWFQADPVAAQLSSSAMLGGDAIPVTARFSGTRGGAHDARTGDQGVSVRFSPPAAPPTDLIAFTLPVFFVRTAADMLEFLEAGAAGPQAMAEFRARHPEADAALAAAGERAPTSYLGQRYHAVHAFGLADAHGETAWARLQWEPDTLVDPLDVDAAAARSADYLTTDLTDRLPAGLTLYARLPREDDPLHDPTAPWSDPPRLVRLGRMNLETRTAECDLDFDPLRLAPGIAAPLDALAADRSRFYRAARALRQTIKETQPQ
ncbi:catalase [Nocardia sp. NBC_00511]|uniref:catalase n=1 Tax=Nocardia sp. NBC_00511 TaxID=2903591 RepID=UPI0030E1ED6B